MTEDRNTSRKKTLLLVQFSILLAVEAVICFTPLGSIPLAPPLIVATLGMIPVVITAIELGTASGALMGFFAGLFSFIVWTFTPPSPIMAFVFTPFYSLGDFHGNFWSIVICFVPRILVGVVAGILYQLFRRIIKPNVTKNASIYLFAAIVCSLIVTVVFAVLGYAIIKIVLGFTVAPVVAWTIIAVLFFVIAVILYHVISQKMRPEHAGDFVIYGSSAIIGSMTNTILVLGGIFLFFGKSYAAGMGIGYNALFGVLGMVVVTNGVPEAILTAVAAYFVCRALRKR